MANKLSFQQIQLLRKINIKPSAPTEFRYLYTGCNIYRALQTLRSRKLIIFSNGKYHITRNGIIVLALYN